MFESETKVSQFSGCDYNKLCALLYRLGSVRKLPDPDILADYAKVMDIILTNEIPNLQRKILMRPLLSFQDFLLTRDPTRRKLYASALSNYEDI